jgi:hypothetical protein
MVALATWSTTSQNKKRKAYLFFCVGDELHAAGAREAVDGLQNTVQ